MTIPEKMSKMLLGAILKAVEDRNDFLSFAQIQEPNAAVIAFSLHPSP